VAIPQRIPLRQPEPRHHLDEAQRIAHVGSWERDIASGYLWWSDESCRILGIEPGTFEGSLDAFLGFVHPEDRAMAVLTDDELANAATHQAEYRIVRPDGRVRIIHEIAEIVRDPNGTPIRLIGTTQDITDRVASEHERARLASAVEQTADSIWMQDLDNNVSYVNRAFTQAYGYEPHEIVGAHASIVDSGRHDPKMFDDVWTTAASGKTWTGSVINKRKDGSVFEVEAVISGMYDHNGVLIGYMQTDRDVTRERALESALERDARERESIETALSRIDSSAPPEVIAATACAEIIKFSDVETAFVIVLEPDEAWVLAHVGPGSENVPSGATLPATRLEYLRERAAGGPWVEAYRPRPEEYAFLDSIEAPRLHSRAYAPFKGPGETIGVIGLVDYDPAGADTLVERLPALVTFGSILGTLIRPGLGARRLEAADRTAMLAVIDAAAFTPYFQPIVDLWDGSVVGHEALTRFTDGRPPNLVFGVAARAGLGIELEIACLRASIEASQRLPPSGYLSLNASPELVLSGKLVSILAELTRPIVVEITEHVEIDDYAGLRRELKRLGASVRLAVDDAGAGYASFRHILELAPDFVKIDLDLVRGVDAEPARQALIAGMTYFAVKRKLRLIAEGIETRKELDALQSLAVPYGQGYLLGRPQDGHATTTWPTKIDLPAFSQTA
jgi:PAS domain S-box-containing protein